MTSRRSAGDLRDIADNLAGPVGGLRKVADGLREVFQAPKPPKTGLQTCKSRPEAASAVLRMTRGQAGSSTGVGAGVGVGVGAGVGDSALARPPCDQRAPSSLRSSSRPASPPDSLSCA